MLFVRPSVVAPLQFLLLRIVEPPLHLLALPLKEAEKILRYRRTYREAVRLQDEVLSLRARLAAMEDVLRENVRLRQLLDFRRTQVFSSVAAEVVGRDPSNWDAVFVVDKGREDGVTVGMPVVHASGVVGRVVEIARHRSKVILLTDPAFSVAAVVGRLDQTGLLSGSLDGRPRLRYLPAGTDVRVGDEVLTSRLSSSFPEGLLIGWVDSVRVRKDETMLTCTVRPAVPLARLSEVLLLRRPEGGF